MFNFIFMQLPWIGLMIAITVQSSFSGLPIPTFGLSFSDKILHFSVFGLLGLLMTRGMLHTQSASLKNKSMWIAVITGMLFAITDEWHQSMVPGRTPEVLDWVADALGILLFSYLYWRWYHRETKTTE